MAVNCPSCFRLSKQEQNPRNIPALAAFQHKRQYGEPPFQSRAKVQKTCHPEAYIQTTRPAQYPAHYQGYNDRRSSTEYDGLWEIPLRNNG